ncbi:MrcB family domain-containing protein [Rummeliibacillus sp. BSL5]
MSIRNALQDIMIRKQSGASVDELVTETLVKELEALPVVMADGNLHIYGRTATGGQSFVPWVGIMNKKLTTTVTQSIYLVFLFSQNGKKVSFSLNQGVTYLDELRKEINDKSVKKLDFFEASSKVLLEKIDDQDGLVTGKLNLVNDQKKNSSGRSYQHSNIIAKEYEVNNLPSEAKIINDIEIMLRKYEELQGKIGDYNSFIKNNFYKAIRYLDNKAKQKEIRESELKLTSPDEVVVLSTENTFDENRRSNNSGGGSSGRGNTISDKNLKVQLDQQNRVGDLAELEVLNYFKEKVREKFGEDKAKEVVQMSKKVGHGLGYDIKAFDLDKNTAQEIHIEVKGTTSNSYKQPFFMSINEIRKLVANERLRIVRVLGVGSGQSKFMIYGGFENYVSLDELLTNKFNAEPINFKINGIKIN